MFSILSLICLKLFHMTFKCCYCNLVNESSLNDMVFSFCSICFLSVGIRLFIFACTCLSVDTFIHLCLYMSKDVEHLPQLLPHLSFQGKVSHWPWSSPTQLDWLASELQVFAQLWLCGSGFTVMFHSLWLFMGARDSKSDPHACMSWLHVTSYAITVGYVIDSLFFSCKYFRILTSISFTHQLLSRVASGLPKCFFFFFNL